MASRRNYAPLFADILSSTRFASVASDDGRLLYLMLLAAVDSWGRHRAKPSKVDAAVWPMLRKGADVTGRALEELSDAGLIRLYRGRGDGADDYLEITRWEQYAGTVGRVAQRGRSRFPEPPGYERPDAWVSARQARTDVRNLSTSDVDVATEWVERLHGDSRAARSQSVSVGDSESESVGGGGSSSPLLSSTCCSTPTTPHASAAPNGRSTGDAGGKARKAWAPRHPDTDAICAEHAAAIRTWKPDAALNPGSKRWREGTDLMLRKDRRDPELVRSVIAWLHGTGEPAYEPAGIDWRTNVMSGETLRKHFDRLETMYQAAMGARALSREELESRFLNSASPMGVSR